jgi:hypothetical protein
MKATSRAGPKGARPSGCRATATSNSTGVTSIATGPSSSKRVQICAPTLGLDADDADDGAAKLSTIADDLSALNPRLLKLIAAVNLNDASMSAENQQRLSAQLGGLIRDWGQLKQSGTSGCAPLGTRIQAFLDEWEHVLLPATAAMAGEANPSEGPSEESRRSSLALSESDAIGDAVGISAKPELDSDGGSFDGATSTGVGSEVGRVGREPAEHGEVQELAAEVRTAGVPALAATPRVPFSDGLSLRHVSVRQAGMALARGGVALARGGTLRPRPSFGLIGSSPLGVTPRVPLAYPSRKEYTRTIAPAATFSGISRSGRRWGGQVRRLTEENRELKAAVRNP